MILDITNPGGGVGSIIPPCFVFVLFIAEGTFACGKTQGAALLGNKSPIPPYWLPDFRRTFPHVVWRMVFTRQTRPDWKKFLKEAV